MFAANHLILNSDQCQTSWKTALLCDPFIYRLIRNFHSISNFINHLRIYKSRTWDFLNLFKYINLNLFKYINVNVYKLLYNILFGFNKNKTLRVDKMRKEKGKKNFIFPFFVWISESNWGGRKKNKIILYCLKW